MNVTVYLPDDIGRRAKAAEFNLSMMLREAILERFRCIEDEKLMQRLMTEDFVVPDVRD